MNKKAAKIALWMWLIGIGLTLVFVFGRLLGLCTWSWWIVFAPFLFVLIVPTAIDAINSKITGTPMGWSKKREIK